MKAEPIKVEVETTRKVTVAGKWVFFEKVRGEKKAIN
jgi:hypothetical protein